MIQRDVIVKLLKMKRLLHVEMDVSIGRYVL
jgi:hypothetical protein